MPAGKVLHGVPRQEEPKWWSLHGKGLCCATCGALAVGTSLRCPVQTTGLVISLFLILLT